MKKYMQFFSVWMSLSLGVMSFAQADQALLSSTESKTKLSAATLLQAWTVYNPNANASLNFRVRRAEIKFTGQSIETVRWFVMIDPAKTLSSTSDNKVLSDIGISYDLTPDMELTVGQFKTASTAEGLDSSGELLFPERALYARTWGDKREPGLRFQYKSGSFKLRTTLTNGNGTNQDDTTGQKDLSARVDYGISDSLSLGAFTSTGDNFYKYKARWGYGFRFNQSGTRVQFEGVKAEDNGLSTSGWGLELAHSLSDSWQPVARATQLNASAYTAANYALGLNYHFAKNQRIGAALDFLKNMSGNNGSPSASSGSNGEQVTVVFQAAL